MVLSGIQQDMTSGKIWQDMTSVARRWRRPPRNFLKHFCSSLGELRDDRSERSPRAAEHVVIAISPRSASGLEGSLIAAARALRSPGRRLGPVCPGAKPDRGMSPWQAPGRHMNAIGWSAFCASTRMQRGCDGAATADAGDGRAAGHANAAGEATTQRPAPRSTGFCMGLPRRSVVLSSASSAPSFLCGEPRADPVATVALFQTTVNWEG